MNTKPLLLILFFLVTLSFSAHGRFITTVTSSSSDLLSDGIHSVQLRSNTSDQTCEETYGFLPCTTTVLGNLFLVITYGYLMFLAARYLSNGSELLLEILGPGIVGGLFLPALGALPDAMLILVSGLSGSKETAQKQVLVGMGLLAGSTVMLLTILWGSCVIVGKTDIEDSKTKDMIDTKRFSLTGSGISTDRSTTYAARIMTISVIPFIIVQLPQIFHTSSGKRIAILISLIVAVAMLLSYCLFQVFQPWIQKRRLAYVKHKHIISKLLKHLKKHALGRLVTESGDPDKNVLEKMFVAIDQDNDTYLSRSELRAFVIGIRFEEIDLDHEEAVQKLLSDFDVNEDEKVDKAEFFKGVSKWVYEARRTHKPTSDSGAHTFVERFHLQTKQDYDELVADQSDEIMEVENVKWVSLKAGLLLLLGTAIAAAFADPLVDAVDNFSTATSIPTFFISFIALPLATNSSEAVSALIFASRKKKTMFSLTFSEIYGAVTMNNLLCLAVFLALVYVRGLTWDFSAEVLVILIVCILMGLVASFRTIFPLWMFSLAYVLYPLSLVLVYVLDNVFGWS